MLRGFFALGLLVSSFAAAHAQGGEERWKDASPTDRQWFKSVRSPHGIPCCDIADGHRTTFEWRQDEEGGHFWVPIEGEMTRVPTEAIVWNAGNPYDTSVVWYVRQGVDADLKNIWYIRCFVPVGGV